MDEITANLTIDVSAGRYGVVSVAALVAGITDALWLRISNVLTIPLIVSGILFHATFPAGEGVLFSLLGACIGFGLLMLLFAAGGVGAGDVKLLTGMGAWIGPHDVLAVFVVAALLHGIYSLVIIIRTSSWKDMPRRATDGFRHLLRMNDTPTDTVEQIAKQDEETRRRRLVPMGTMIAFALLILLMRNFLEAPDPAAESRTTTFALPFHESQLKHVFT